MRRRLLQLGLFLLLGAIVNVAVAWGCVVLTSFTDVSSYSGSQSEDIAWLTERRWRKLADTSSFTYPLRTTEHAGPGLRFRWIEESRDIREGAEHRFLSYNESRWAFCTLTEAGWPVLSMEGHQVLEEALRRSEVGGVLIRSKATRFPLLLGDVRSDGTIRITKYLDKYPWLGGRFVPLIPRWPGFAVNTLFYATILWSLFVAPFTLQRRRRIKRGLCPACAYPVGENAICTECGVCLNPKTMGAA
jgi:hypothetical protein